MLVEAFISRLNAYRSSRLHRDAEQHIEALLTEYANAPGLGPGFITAVWEALEEELMRETSRPHQFALREVRHAAAKALRKLDRERCQQRAAAAGCDKCLGSGTVLIYGTHTGTGGAGEAVFWPWQVHADCWPEDWPVGRRLYRCVCGRVSDRSPILRATGEMMAGLRHYYLKHLWMEPRPGVRYPNHARAENCCIRALLAEAGRTDCRQYERMAEIAERANYPAVDGTED